MVNKSLHSARRVSAIFSALADPTRRRMIERLSLSGEQQVTSLASPFRVSLPAIARHLRVLERARLIHRRRKGRLHLIRTRKEGFKDAQEWLGHWIAGWDHSFDALEQILKDQMLKKEKRS